MKKYIVYEHISPSGKVYVGISSEINIRWQGEGHRYLAKKKNGNYNQPYFAKALLKYGWDNFIHNIVLEGVMRSEALYAEKCLIKWYKLHNQSYNCTDGGEGTCGIKRSMSSEMRRHMSEVMRAYHPLRGTHRTEKQKQSAREKMLGRKASAETRAKMSKTHKGTRNPWKHKEVFAFDKQTGEFVKRYESITDAAKELNISTVGISNAARGNCPSAGPYIWSYVPSIDINNSRYSRMINSKVYCYNFAGDLVAVYNSTREAAVAVQGSANCIRNCCLGINITHKGFIWRKKLESISSELTNKLLKRKIV